MIGNERQDEVAQRNWATAVQTYHTALLTYRRLVEARAQRQAQRAQPLPPLVAPRKVRSASLDHLEVLSPREREVAYLIARGCSNQQIANTLVLTRGTVANHVAHILEKLGLANRTQVAAIVLVQAEPPLA